MRLMNFVISSRLMISNCSEIRSRKSWWLKKYDNFLLSKRNFVMFCWSKALFKISMVVFYVSEDNLQRMLSSNMFVAIVV